MKAILVIDEMPKDCGDCRLIDNVSDDNTRARCTGVVYARDEYHRYIGINDKPDWCPLKPLPQKKEVEVNKIEDIMHTEYSIEDIYKNKYIADIRLATDKLIALGYNRCIDEILGGKE